jgi:NADPH2:quinone reductase
VLTPAGPSRGLALEAHRLKIPDAMPFDEAAAFVNLRHQLACAGGALLEAGQTCWCWARRGVGLAAVELGHDAAPGDRRCSSQEKVDLCIKHGAAGGVVYPRGPFDRDGQKALAGLFKEACGPNGADVIYDPIGDAYAEPALRSIAWEGTYLVVGFAAGEIPKVPLNLALLKGCQIVGVFWGGWSPRTRSSPEERRRAVGDVRRGQDQALRPRALPLARRRGDAHLATRPWARSW